MSEHCVIGSGFLATALRKKLNATFYPVKETKYMFYMSSVTHMDFEKNPEYHMQKVITDFDRLLPYCDCHGIKFIYASSALVYEFGKRDTQFVKTKLLLEQRAGLYKNTLGLRIFPVYGKGDHTVFSKWIDDIKNNCQPIIYGDGTQIRSFIFIDDFTEMALNLKDYEGTVDIGGQTIQFNEIVEKINKVLEKKIEPLYARPPEGYTFDGPKPTNWVDFTYTTYEEGIKSML